MLDQPRGSGGAETAPVEAPKRRLQKNGLGGAVTATPSLEWRLRQAGVSAIGNLKMSKLACVLSTVAVGFFWRVGGQSALLPLLILESSRSPWGGVTRLVVRTGAVERPLIRVGPSCN